MSALQRFAVIPGNVWMPHRFYCACNTVPAGTAQPWHLMCTAHSSRHQDGQNSGLCCRAHTSFWAAQQQRECLKRWETSTSREWGRTWIIQQDGPGWWGWTASVDHNVGRDPLPLGPIFFSALLAWGFCPEKPVWGTGMVLALALMWDQSKDRILCQGTSEAHPSLLKGRPTSGQWSRVQVEAGFKAHLSCVLTAQDLAQQCLSPPMNLQSHRGWIQVSTVKLWANCWCSPESSRLG